MKTGYRAWTDEHMKLLATLIAEGKSNEEIAFLMDRSVEAIKIRMQRHGLRRVVGADGKVHRVAAIPQEKPVKFKPVVWRDAS